MTPTLFDLPIRPPEAAQLAVLILGQAGDQPFDASVRNRIAARSAMLRLDTIRPFFGSLARDPIHPSAIYLAVDGIDDQPLLLRIAPNATPSSGLFPKSILIGRMPGPAGIEVVVNATPFAHHNAEPIGAFATKVDKAFGARPHSTRSAILVQSKSPEKVYPSAFDAFRTILKERNLNLAGFSDELTATWAAIRNGWREGFIVEAKEIIPPAQLNQRQRGVCALEIDDASQAAELIDRCSQFLL